MATVHRATLAAGGGIEREVALKRLLPHMADDERVLRDFIREAKLASQLRHPNIIQIYELGKIEDTYFIAMELVRGVSLITLMRNASKRERLLPLGAVLSLMLELTDALDHAHAAALIHRDLTPTNLLVSDDGHLKIIDFGVAKSVRGDLATDSGRAKGKLGYMAIEALRARSIDARADLFSAGVVMWELLTNRRLFKFRGWDMIETIYNTVVPPPSRFNPACPSELDAIVLRAVAKHPDNRWQSALSLHRSIAAIARDLSASTLDVVRAKQSLRPETSSDPYAGYELELEVDVDEDSGDALDIGTPVAGSPFVNWSGLWSSDPETEPKLHIGATGSSNWAVEPPTEEKAYPTALLVAAGRGGYDDTTSTPIDPGTDPTKTRPRIDLASPEQTPGPEVEPPTDPTARRPELPTEPFVRTRLGALRPGARRRAQPPPIPPQARRGSQPGDDTVEAKRYSDGDTTETSPFEDDE